MGGRGSHGPRARDPAARRPAATSRSTTAPGPKREPLAERGATIVDAPADLADRDIVFTIVAGPDDFQQVVAGPDGLLSGSGPRPRRRRRLHHGLGRRVGHGPRRRRRGAAPRCWPRRSAATRRWSRPGRLTMVTSGPADAHRAALPYLKIMAGGGVTYVRRGRARAARQGVPQPDARDRRRRRWPRSWCSAEKGGVSRADLMEFLNNSVLGSMFTRYKTPAYVNLDFSPTFTPALLLKDFDLGHEAARELGRADAGGVRGPAGRAGADRQRLHRRRLRGADRARGQGVRARARVRGAPVSDGLERAA